jgi:alkylation response protein AidB-like acyl-CoA dehydrogenase
MKTTTKATAMKSVMQALADLNTVASPERLSIAAHHLRQAGLLGGAHLRDATRPAAGAPSLFADLVALGRTELSVARIYEGHVNAMQLIARYGSNRQQKRAEETVAHGGLLGVWGADDFADPGRIIEAGKNHILAGRKTFASGAGVVQLAVIAVKTEGGATQLVLADGRKLADRFDVSWWHPIGMQATNSHAVALSGIGVETEDLLGSPGDYHKQPFFGAGAIRFVAGQLGGALAVGDAARNHLVRTGRHEDPHQALRLGHMIAELEAAYCHVRDAYIRLAPLIAWNSEEGSPVDTLIADSARIHMEGAAERVMAIATRSVGCAGLMTTHPLAKALCDLTVYLRQPAPDGAVIRLSKSVGESSYKAAFDDR